MAQANCEADAIESAYSDHVEILYKNLVGCLMDSGGALTPGAELQCIQRFTTGLNLARRARELALTICSATGVSATSAARKVALGSPASPTASPPTAAPKVAVSSAKPIAPTAKS